MEDNKFVLISFYNFVDNISLAIWIRSNENVVVVVSTNTLDYYFSYDDNEEVEVKKYFFV